MGIKIKNLEFENDELSEYKSKIWHESKELIEKIIKEQSPIQVGEDVEIVSYRDSDFVKMRVTTVKLMAIDSWGEPGRSLSFYYEGVRLSKKGEPMKGRNPERFSSFRKDGKEYSSPSYFRVEIAPAIIHRNER